MKIALQGTYTKENLIAVLSKTINNLPESSFNNPLFYLYHKLPKKQKINSYSTAPIIGKDFMVCEDEFLPWDT